MDKKPLHHGLNLGPSTPNPNTVPSELSGMMELLGGNDGQIQILNSDYLSPSPQIQQSDSVSLHFKNSFCCYYLLSIWMPEEQN